MNHLLFLSSYIKNKLHRNEIRSIGKYFVAIKKYNSKERGIEKEREKKRGEKAGKEAGRRRK